MRDIANAIPDSGPEADPFVLFAQWFDEARASEPSDSNAMALATSTVDGMPSVRMVLLKGHGEDGFVFYTNAQSRKGVELRENPQAALLFHWKSLRRQIRIEGALSEVSAGEANDYFYSRHFVSQVGSAASDQSRQLADRAQYLERVEQLRDQYEEGGRVPRPEHWTGFRLVPRKLEFWLDRPNRLHERREFNRVDVQSDWTSSLLYP